MNEIFHLSFWNFNARTVELGTYFFFANNNCNTHISLFSRHLRMRLQQQQRQHHHRQLGHHHHHHFDWHPTGHSCFDVFVRPRIGHSCSGDDSIGWPGFGRSCFGDVQLGQLIIRWASWKIMLERHRLRIRKLLQGLQQLRLLGLRLLQLLQWRRPHRQHLQHHHRLGRLRTEDFFVVWNEFLLKKDVFFTWAFMFWRRLDWLTWLWAFMFWRLPAAWAALSPLAQSVWRACAASGAYAYPPAGPTGTKHGHKGPPAD